MSLHQWGIVVKEALEKTFLFAKFFCALHVTNTYLCTHALVVGPSMLPTFNLTGNLVLAERISARFGKLSPGDIVLIRSPENPRKIITKRLIAMEGDTVKIDNTSDTSKTLVVPKGHVWIEGDNKYDSSDSRKFGPVPYGLLHGRVFWRIWPTEDFGSVGKRAKDGDPVN